MTFSNLKQYDTVPHQLAGSGILSWLIHRKSNLRVTLNPDMAVLVNASQTNANARGKIPNVKHAWTFEGQQRPAGRGRTLG